MKLKQSFKVGKEATLELSKALGEIAAAVGSTLGPGGRPFGYDKLDASMRLTSSFSKDGLTVLRALRFDDKPEYQAVLNYCRQASSHSVMDSGDGSSSTVVLANAVCQEIIKCNEKFPQSFARKLEKDAKRAIAEIRKQAITSKDAVRKVALTSSNGDEELTDVVLDAINASSAFGTILLNKNPTVKQRYQIKRQDGYSNCAGYEYNSTFALSADPLSASGKEMEWNNPSILIFNGDLVLANQLEPIMKQWSLLASQTGVNRLVIVAYNVSDEVCNSLMVFNRKNAQYDNAVFVIRPRLTAEPNSAVHIIRDIAAFCGIADSKIVDGGNLRTGLDPSYFGACKIAKIGRMSTVFLGRPENHWVTTRIQQNESLVEQSRNQFDKELGMIRNAELSEGLVTVEIGGGLLPDLHERADRFDDAQKAAKACMAAGALPGCGVAYIMAAQLAGVDPALESALRCVYQTVLLNYGDTPDYQYQPKAGKTVCITEDGIVEGDALELGILDACDTVTSVIQNGVDLGVKIATLGGYLFRDQDYEDVSIMRS